MTDQNHDLFTDKGTQLSKDVLVERLATDASNIQSGSDEHGAILRNSVDTEPIDIAQEHNRDGSPAEPPSEQQLQRSATTGEDYSVLTVTQKKLIIIVASLASLFSPMATAIYCSLHLNLIILVPKT
jgi:hypothetical protein